MITKHHLPIPVAKQNPELYEGQRGNPAKSIKRAIDRRG